MTDYKGISILFILCCFFSHLANAQLITEEPQGNSVQFYFGRGIHGSGDISGFAYGLNYERDFHKRWFWNLSFDSSLFDDQATPFIFEDQNGTIINSTQHRVISGFQLTLGTGYRFINNERHRLSLNPGVVLRYQASSLNDIETTLFPIITGFPIPIRVIENFQNNRTVAVGGVLRVNYDYLIKSKYLIGIQGGWQVDSNEDTIAHTAIRFGLMF